MTQNLTALDNPPATVTHVGSGAACRPRTVSRHGFLLAIGVCLASVYLLGMGKIWGDLSLACLLAGVSQELRRGCLITASILLLFAAFPPLAIPYSYLFCWAPLFYLWRYEPIRGLRGCFEAWIAGFASAWISAPFLSGGAGTNGRWLLTLACGIVGLQWLATTMAIRSTRNLAIWWSAPLVAVVAAGLELMRTDLLGFPVLLLAFPAASTPLAQWANFVSIFGVSAILYCINFLLVPSFHGTSAFCWRSTGVACVVFAAAWAGGNFISAETRFSPFPLRALVVQPRGRSEVAVNGLKGGLEGAHIADRLTTEALTTHGRPDLIIWPEAVLSRSTMESSVAVGEVAVDDVDRIDLNVFRQRLLPRYGCSCLVGAPIVGSHGRLFNSACLIEPNGSITRHDKLKLIVLSETLPEWLPQAWKESLCRYFRVKAPYVPGDRFCSLVLPRSHRPSIRIAVSLCYEMHFPGMPQFRKATESDVVIHMTDESWFRGFAGHPQHGTWACQYRAIETRRWQLVCANWANSAVIDPTGRIRQFLPASAGWLRTTEADNGR